MNQPRRLSNFWLPKTNNKKMAKDEKSVRQLAIICMQYPPERGAAPSRIAKMAAGLIARNISVTVYTALPNYPTGRIFPGYRGSIVVSEILDGVSVKRYWLYPSNSPNVLKRFLNMMSFAVGLLLSAPHLISHRPDRIIVNIPPLPVALYSLLLAKVIRVPAITNVSDIWPMTALELGALRSGWFFRFLEWIEKRVYGLSNATMTQSIETQEHIHARFPAKKSFLYRNLDYLSGKADDYPALDERPVRIVYAGLLGVAQGVYDICTRTNFAALNSEFHVYGDGHERSRLEAYISGNPGCNVFLHQTVPKGEMPDLLSQYHATIVPLKNHIRGAFPSKIYMALSAALPVLYCGSGEAARFVQETGIGWVSGPSDYNGLSQNIESLLQMPEDDYKMLRIRIKRLAESGFDLDDQLDRLEEFINAVE